MLNDTTRAAFMLVVTNLVTLAVAFGVHLSTEQVTYLESTINSALILLMLVVKHGQSAGPTPEN